MVSPKLLGELSEVLAREKFRRWIGADAAAEFIAVLAEEAIMVDDVPSPSKPSPDPADDYLRALTSSAVADYLVSGDGHLTGLQIPSRRS